MSPPHRNFWKPRSPTLFSSSCDALSSCITSGLSFRSIMGYLQHTLHASSFLLRSCFVVDPCKTNKMSFSTQLSSNHHVMYVHDANKNIAKLWNRYSQDATSDNTGMKVHIRILIIEPRAVRAHIKLQSRYQCTSRTLFLLKIELSAYTSLSWMNQRLSVLTFCIPNELLHLLHGATQLCFCLIYIAF